MIIFSLQIFLIVLLLLLKMPFLPPKHWVLSYLKHWWRFWFPWTFNDWIFKCWRPVLGRWSRKQRVGSLSSLKLILLERWYSVSYSLFNIYSCAARCWFIFAGTICYKLIGLLVFYIYANKLLEDVPSNLCNFSWDSLKLSDLFSHSGVFIGVSIISFLWW